MLSSLRASGSFLQERAPTVFSLAAIPNSFTFRTVEKEAFTSSILRTGRSPINGCSRTEAAPIWEESQRTARSSGLPVAITPRFMRLTSLRGNSLLGFRSAKVRTVCASILNRVAIPWATPVCSAEITPPSHHFSNLRWMRSESGRRQENERLLPDWSAAPAGKGTIIPGKGDSSIPSRNLVLENFDEYRKGLAGRK